jgi:transcription elongation factor GreA
MESVPLTPEGMENLKRSLMEMEQRRPQLLHAIQEAREKGDLSENAEYHAAREDLALLEAHIAELRDKLSRAQVVDPNKIGGENVVFGATVKVLNMDDNEEEEYILVGVGSEDPFRNKILTTSPMGRALLTKKVGDIVKFPAPKGELTFKVLQIRFE